MLLQDLTSEVGIECSVGELLLGFLDVIHLILDDVANYMIVQGEFVPSNHLSDGNFNFFKPC